MERGTRERTGGTPSSTERARDHHRSPGHRPLTGAIQRKARPSGGATSPTAAATTTTTSAAVADPCWFATGAVQAHGGDVTGGDEQVHAAAEAGVAGATAALPHLDRVQQSFGRHDVSGVRAAVGGDAGRAARSISASAYATGDRVAFADAPDLHTAAHEAAHVIQQRGGVQLKGGVSQVDDPYERHADAVADMVVQGKSAESLLDQHAGGGSGGSVVQRRMVFTRGTDYLNIDGAGHDIDHAGYQATLREALDMRAEVGVSEGTPSVGVAKYTPDRTNFEARRGDIVIRPIDPGDLRDKTRAYNDRVISMAHETRHAVDDLADDRGQRVPYRGGDNDAKIHTEWRAFATQSAVALEMSRRGQPVSDRFLLDIAPYASKEAFMNPRSRMVETTMSYMRIYGMESDPQPRDAVAFMRRHEDWVEEAIALFNSLAPRELPRAAVDRMRPARASEDDWSGALTGPRVAIAVVVVGVVLYALAKIFGLL